ncbi:MAG TPA: pyridoxal phosphate-dependent aminotransferase [Gemmatimonadaceae bacterium]|nr:pyridoxal phosphate-dependent aminotransferase [Gemmatimonadaceae bacterium]
MAPEFTPSPNIALLRESATIAVSQRAKALKAEGRAIIDLGAGEPDFDTPAFIREAAKAAIDAGHTRYTATEGILPLRSAIAEVARAYGPAAADVAPLDVVVSNGSKQSLFNACFCLFGPGDEVLIPTPAWTSYYEMVQLARATPVAVLGDPANGLKVTADALAAAATPRTRGVMLNSPCNPTGAVYSAGELRAIVALARERGWWMISDEIYRRISYEGEAPSALQVAEARDHLVVVDGVAKAYAMTGWRVGWTVAPRALSRAMTAFQSHATFHTASMSQYGALAALTRREESDAAIAAMVAQYRVRRDAALAVLAAEPTLPIVRPTGAFYVYLDVSAAFPGHAEPGSAFAARLLEESGVAMVPGAAFHSPAWIRASYAAPQHDVVEGITRALRLWKSLAG